MVKASKALKTIRKWNGAAGPLPADAMDEPDPTEEVGYCRVSASDQSADMQIALMKKRGIPDNNLFVDTGSGAKMNRKQLRLALMLMRGRPGWTLVVYKLDRLGRDVKGLIDLMEEFRKEQWNLVSLTEQLDTRTPFGKFYLHMLASLAQLERDMTVERTKAGMARLKERGVPLGRQVRMSRAQFKQIEKMLLTTNTPISRIAEQIEVTYKLKKKEVTKAISAPAINHWFPGWRSKTDKERSEWRKLHPIPNSN